jgi:hypothetical protein
MAAIPHVPPPPPSPSPPPLPAPPSIEAHAQAILAQSRCVLWMSYVELPMPFVLGSLGPNVSDSTTSSYDSDVPIRRSFCRHAIFDIQMLRLISSYVSPPASRRHYRRLLAYVAKQCSKHGVSTRSNGQQNTDIMSIPSNQHLVAVLSTALAMGFRQWNFSKETIDAILSGAAESNSIGRFRTIPLLFAYVIMCAYLKLSGGTTLWIPDLNQSTVMHTVQWKVVSRIIQDSSCDITTVTTFARSQADMPQLVQTLKNIPNLHTLILQPRSLPPSLNNNFVAQSIMDRKGEFIVDSLFVQMLQCLHAADSTITCFDAISPRCAIEERSIYELRQNPFVHLEQLSLQAVLYGDNHATALAALSDALTSASNLTYCHLTMLGSTDDTVHNPMDELKRYSSTVQYDGAPVSDAHTEFIKSLPLCRFDTVKLNLAKLCTTGDELVTALGNLIATAGADSKLPLQHFELFGDISNAAPLHSVCKGLLLACENVHLEQLSAIHLNMNMTPSASSSASGWTDTFQCLSHVVLGCTSLQSLDIEVPGTHLITADSLLPLIAMLPVCTASNFRRLSLKAKFHQSYVTLLRLCIEVLPLSKLSTLRIELCISLHVADTRMRTPTGKHGDLQCLRKTCQEIEELSVELRKVAIQCGCKVQLIGMDYDPDSDRFMCL